MNDRFGGTSSATPLVAGIAGLVISANPELTALDVVSILKRTAAKNLNQEGYSRTPPANYDPNPSWDVSPVAPFNSGVFVEIGSPDGTWSPWFGHGRVDAADAVAEALSRRVTPGQQTYRRSSAPALDIPDNNPTGVRNTISFTEAAVISTVKVTVDITHTFIGDLKLTLTAPSGASVVLHDRSGGNARNLQRSFDAASTPALNALAGQALTGNWTLHVQDLAAQDAGKLNRWEVEVAGTGDAAVTLAESPGVTIPDNDPNGIVRTLETTEAGKVKEIEVAVDITHTYIGDLHVTLSSPAGTQVVLHQETGGGADNLIQTYTMATTPALQALRGQPVRGAWRLKVADTEAADVGKLNRWSVRIVREP